MRMLSNKYRQSLQYVERIQPHRNLNQGFGNSMEFRCKKNWINVYQWFHKCQ